MDQVTPDEPTEPPELEEHEPTACERCGNFAELTHAHGRELCDACRARRLPLALRGADLGNLVADTARLIWALGWRVPAIVIVTSLPWAIVWTFVLQEESELMSTLVGTAMGLVSGPVADTAIACLAVRRSRLEPMSMTKAFQRSLLRLPHVLAIEIAVLVAIVLGLLFFIIPGLVLAAGLFLAPLIAGVEDVSLEDALRRSWARTERHRVAILVGAFALGLLGKGSEYVLGLGEEAFYGAQFWYEVLDPWWTILSDGSVFVLTLVVHQILWIPQRMLPVTAYVKLDSD